MARRKVVTHRKIEQGVLTYRYAYAVTVKGNVRGFRLPDVCLHNNTSFDVLARRMRNQIVGVLLRPQTFVSHNFSHEAA